MHQLTYCSVTKNKAKSYTQANEGKLIFTGGLIIKKFNYNKCVQFKI